LTQRPHVPAEKITRQSNSNLALAFIALGRERRHDITTFYAFCRLIDDIADDGELGRAEKQRRLDIWRSALRRRIAAESSIAPNVRALIAEYRLSPEMLDEIISGVEMDLYTARYATFEDLRIYCYRVASAVGLVSIEIFGYQNPRCREYAINLGMALQITNIIRDVERDLEQDRIYLPQEDMAQFDYSEADLLARKYDERFTRLMEFEAGRADVFFRLAREALPPEDRRSMVAPEIMASVYGGLLQRMRRGRFRVFNNAYRVGKLAKLGYVAAQLLKFG